MYKQTKIHDQTYYYYDIYNNAYLPATENGRTRLYGLAEDELDDKVRQLNETLNAERKKAVSLARNFYHLYLVYLKEYFPSQKRELLVNYDFLFRYFSDGPDTKEIYIAFFQRAGLGRSQKAMEQIFELVSEISDFGLTHAYPGHFPKEEIKEMVGSYESDPDYVPIYSKEECDRILTGILKYDNTYFYESTAILLPLVTFVYPKIEPFISAVWSDLTLKDDQVYIRIDTKKKFKGTQLGTNDYLIPDTLFWHLCRYNKDRYEVSKENLRTLPQNDRIFIEAANKSLFGRRIHKLLIRLGLKDEIRPVKLIEQLKEKGQPIQSMLLS